MCVVRRVVETVSIVSTIIEESDAPEGAITSLQDLNKALIGKKELPIFIASNKFRSVDSLIYRGESGQRLHQDKSGIVEDVYEYFKVFNVKYNYTSERSMLDAHLLPQEYNDWYVFIDETQAKNFAYSRG